jgi:hypothetical protein
MIERIDQIDPEIDAAFSFGASEGPREIFRD